MPALIRTLSQLPELSSGDQLQPQSLFEVSVPAEVKISGDQYLYKFVSRKITEEHLADKMVKTVREDLIDKNGLSADLRVDDLHDTVDHLINGPETFKLYGTKDFQKNPLIDNAPLSANSITAANLDRYSVNFGTLKRYTSVNSSPSIGPNFGFVTQLSSAESGSQATSRYLNLFRIDRNGSKVVGATAAPNFVFDQSAKNIAQNEFIFKIKQGERSSGVWTAPASGIFTCYGWLDEINNPSPSNESRWVALMGRQAQIDVWTILQVQPFIKNNYLSYVGFTFPVKKEMQLKVVTGFAVGSNSDKYFAATGSLTNHVANAFLGGIYTGLSADNGSGSNYPYENIDYGYAKIEDLAELSKHETSCDLSVIRLIDDLSSKISNAVVIPDSDNESIISAINNRVKYVDANKLSGSDPIVYSEIRFGGANHKYGVFTEGVLQKSSVDGEYQCIRLEDFTSRNAGDELFMYKNYYAPPSYPDTYGDEPSIVERAYTLDTMPGGKVASDGQYYYYKTSKDCTLLIKFSTDVFSGTKVGPQVLKAWMLYDTERGYDNVKALPLIEKVESIPAHGYPSESISVPVKAGTIIMFSVYARQSLPAGTPWYEDCLQPPVLYAGNLIKPWTLKTLKEDQKFLTGEWSYRSSVASGGHVTLQSIMLYANGSNMSDIASTSPNSKQANINDMSFGDVAFIYELP